MIKLYDYYKKNINENNYYYYKYNNKIEEYFVFELEFEYFDENELIKRFRVLTYPSNKIDPTQDMEFIMLCYYLNNEGFVVNDFPNILNRPKKLDSFSLDIREIILSENENLSVVTWKSRREYANQMEIKKKNNNSIVIETDLNDIFKKISNRNADFDNMSKNEKLAEICNAIENLLKDGKTWLEVDYETETFGFITNELVLDYRKKIQCFRHSSNESIEERENLSDKQKDFLINYGITICDFILKYIIENN